MEESRLVGFDGALRESGLLAGMSEAPETASVERQFEERLSRIHDVESERADTEERLLFWIGDKPYSAALTALREALPTLPKAVPLPFSPAWLVGLFPLRTDLIALIDLRPLLENDMDAATAGSQIAPMDAEQALLIGEAGRLIAFVVDRIGDIVSVSETAALPYDEEQARLGVPARYVEGMSLLDSEGREAVMALNLTALYEDVIDKLEVWSRDA